MSHLWDLYSIYGTFFLQSQSTAAPTHGEGEERCGGGSGSGSGGGSGSSEVEVSEIKDRLNDALNATKAAVEEGIIPGGGVGLLRASQKLAHLKTENFDQQVGVDIIKNAIRVPCKTISENAGIDGAVVVQNILQVDKYSHGYNAQSGLYVDMIEAGIVDPTKVIRTALADASSVASLMTTTECVIVDMPKEESKGNAGGRGGMEDNDY
jgi:chaperonin GroEL